MLSFLAGPRGCIGKTMAIITMKAVLAYVTIIVQRLYVQHLYAQILLLGL